MAPRDALEYAESDRVWLEDYLPNHTTARPAPSPRRPWVTLTYATSLDSGLAIAPGQQTALSGPQSKAMTHFLRSRHDVILIGVSTAVVDDPSLNCRLQGVGGYGGEGLGGQPQPVVLDPQCRWAVEDSKILSLARQGRGKAPLIFCVRAPPDTRKDSLHSAGGMYICLHSMTWEAMFENLHSRGLKSVMVEGGRTVINDLLSPSHQGLIDSVILTIAPTWLGRTAVKVDPEQGAVVEGSPLPVGRLDRTRWQQLGADVVLCGVLTTT